MVMTVTEGSELAVPGDGVMTDRFIAKPPPSDGDVNQGDTPRHTRR